MTSAKDYDDFIPDEDTRTAPPACRSGRGAAHFDRAVVPAAPRAGQQPAVGNPVRRVGGAGPARANDAQRTCRPREGAAALDDQGGGLPGGRGLDHPDAASDGSAPGGADPDGAGPG